VSDPRWVRTPNKLCAGQMSSWREGENTDKLRNDLKLTVLSVTFGNYTRYICRHSVFRVFILRNNVFLQKTTVNGVAEMSSSLHLHRKNLACTLRTDVTDG